MSSVRLGRLVLCALWLLAGGALAAACAAPLQESSAVAPSNTPAISATENLTENATETAMELAVETMHFDGQNTFLDWASNVLSAEGEPTSRHYVEVSDRQGIVWQGERLRYAAQEIWLLQPAQRGPTLGIRVDVAMAALQIEVNDAATLEAVAAQLPVVQDGETAAPDVETRFVRARLQNGRWSFDVTLAHPDTGWDDYADGWQIETPDGVILGVRILLHPHETEQPFTRSLSGVDIPTGLDEVVIRTHDLVSGYGAGELHMPLGAPAATDVYEVIR